MNEIEKIKYKNSYFDVDIIDRGLTEDTVVKKYFTTAADAKNGGTISWMNMEIL